ncbi:hypothetical protein [Methylobacterium radiodurans]|uniref:Uncharacterized protein n=1 Tax=Methylobacterium radiodurans TaxID=2202828 RepID=A0A2U8VNS9_9HYPH|nr:hypothetical protein [Methylobacterium radiodurans]AWN35091.1 hypothetical protein DK427_04475 [Methylobacterium radiodurans]
MAALDTRVREAFEEADRGGSADRLARFREVAKTTCAVTVMSITDMRMLLSENRLWVSFYKQVNGAGSRQSEWNKWDFSRGSNDQKVNPQYSDHINYAALSLGDFGAGWYGGCHAKLVGDRISTRASVFWENPFVFLKNTHVPPDALVPPGYRASWERRSDLAVAKLHPKIGSSTAEAEFPGIVLEHDPSRGDTDFIEVHIYGAVGQSAIAQVSVDTSRMDEDDALEWSSLKRRLDAAGILVRDVANA